MSNDLGNNTLLGPLGPLPPPAPPPHPLLDPVNNTPQDLDLPPRLPLQMEACDVEVASPNQILAAVLRQETALRSFTDLVQHQHVMICEKIERISKINGIYQELSERGSSPRIPEKHVSREVTKGQPEAAARCEKPKKPTMRTRPSFWGRANLTDGCCSRSSADMRKDIALLENYAEAYKVEKTEADMGSRPLTCMYGIAQRFCRIVESDAFEMFIGVVILLNALTMALEVQYHGAVVGSDLDYARSRAPPKWVKSVVDVIKDILLCIFVGEVFAKLVAFRLRFFTAPNRYWNFIDLFIVGYGAMERLSLADLGMDATMVRLLRLIKLTRFLKLFKSLGSSLQTMMLILKSVRASQRTLFWSLLLLFIVQYVTGMFVCQLTAGSFMDRSIDKDTRTKLYEYYGTFSRAQLTMFEITHVNYTTAVRLLCESISEWWGWFFVLYRCIITFAFISVIRAVFIQSTLKVAERDKDLLLASKQKAAHELEEKIKDIFHILFGHIADNAEFEISHDEFLEVFMKESTKVWMSALDIDTSYPEGLYRLMDVDGGGGVSLQECIYVAEKIRGPARSIDLYYLRSQVDRMEAKVDALLPEELRGDVYPDTVTAGNW